MPATVAVPHGKTAIPKPTSRAPYQTGPGRAHPLGSTVDKEGVNFSVFSRNATGVELLLFDQHDDVQPIQIIKLEPADVRAVAARHRLLGERFLYCEGVVELLFTENETNTQRAFNQPNRQPYCKDGIIQAVVHGNKNT